MIRTRNFGVSLILGAIAANSAFGADFVWQTVANNGYLVPGDPQGRNFNSYNQPSVNTSGLVVFRARSKGGSGGEPAHGIYSRNMASPSPIVKILDRNTLVPMPNNLGSTFIEPPSFPRIDIFGTTIASRGNHQPVWEYMLPDGTDSKAGTTGIYATPGGILQTAASNLGNVPGFEFFAVPGTALKFDVFPGAPAVANPTTIVTKGNYTDGAGVSRTGIYYRETAPPEVFPQPSMIPIADTASTMIPGTTTLFGSTAPPSAVGNRVVFAGFDIEEAPTKGGIYMAEMTGPYPALRTLVPIGGQVPGEARGKVFNKLGEGLSFDGRFVSFWGAWGTETKTIVLQCPTDGNKELIDYCMELYPNGYETTVPKYQGFFVYDTVTNLTLPVSKTPNNFDDFVYWNFSGRVPGTGEGDDDGELARWRSATFAAVNAAMVYNNLVVRVAFKARKGQIVNNEYQNPKDGIYLNPKAGLSETLPLVVTGQTGTRIDRNAVYDHDENPVTLPIPLPVTAMGIERDGFRGDILAVTAGMGTEEAGWAGVYMTVVPKNLVAPPRR
ncbi:hypothetical protein GC170_20005 [bacterium]|nr:hypothetical protein [bacterium]